MGDFMDRVQERELHDRERAIDQHRQPVKPGPAHCIHPDCERDISAVRRSLGARLCLEHQCAKEDEARRRGARTAV